MYITSPISPHQSSCPELEENEERKNLNEVGILLLGVPLFAKRAKILAILLAKTARKRGVRKAINKQRRKKSTFIINDVRRQRLFFAECPERKRSEPETTIVAKC